MTGYYFDTNNYLYKVEEDGTMSFWDDISRCWRKSSYNRPIVWSDHDKNESYRWNHRITSKNLNLTYISEEDAIVFLVIERFK